VGVTQSDPHLKIRQPSPEPERFGGVGFGMVAESAGFFPSPDDFQITDVAPHAPRTMSAGTMRRIIAASSPLMLVLKNPNVKIQATESQITHVEIVLLKSLFIIFFGFVVSVKLSEF
jgi:hypothetical protein